MKILFVLILILSLLLGYLWRQPITVDNAGPSKVFSDFSGLHQKVPSKIIEVRDGSEVQKLFQSLKNVNITIRGAGHSLSGLTTTNDTLLLNNNKKVLQLNGDLVEVSSGFSVGEVEEYLNARGLHLQCLQDHHIFSVGGTIAVGGIGWDSNQCGTFGHWVRELQIILPNGTQVTASNATNRDIFLFTMGGLGQTGYIDKVTILTVPWKPFWKYGVIYFDTINEAFEFLKENFLKLKSDAIDAFHGGRLKIENKIHFNIGKRFFTEEQAKKWDISGLFNKKPSHYMEGVNGIEIPFSLSKLAKYQLWSDYSFQEIESARKFTEAIFSQEGMAMPIPELFKSQPEFMFLAFYLFKPQGLDIPLSLIPPNSTDFVISIGTYYATRDFSKTEMLKETLARNLDYCIQFHGRPYNYGYVPLSSEQAEIVYGRHYSDFVRLKQELKGSNNWIKSSFTALTL